MLKIRNIFTLHLFMLFACTGFVFAADSEIKSKIKVSAKRVKAGERVHFDAGSSVAGRGAELYGIYWDFNDMDLVDVDATGDTVSHVFNRAGAYNVKLIVENERGERDQATTSIEVLPDTDLGPAITDYFQGGKTGIFIKSEETFAFRLEWGGQFFFRIDNCKNVPLSLRIYGYGPNRPVPESVTPYADDYSFDEHFTLMANTYYNNPDWRPLTEAKYSYDPKTAALVARFTPESESIYLAWASPYTMRNLEQFLDRWEDRPEFSWQPIGMSVEGRPILQITVTDPGVDDSGKKVVWITGTQHAYEMAAGPVCEGIVEALLEKSDSAKTVLKKFVYHLVPLMNPDATSRGGYRYNMHDVDLNRNWDDYQQDEWDRAMSEPEVAAVQRAIRNWVSGGGGLDFFFDFHCLTRLSDNLLIIKAVPDSMPQGLAEKQDRFIKEFFAKRYVWRISEGKEVSSANGAIAGLYAWQTGVLSFTSEHALGRITPAGKDPVRTTPALLRKLGTDYVWTIKEYFDSVSE
ncbi:MAG TPA: M14 family zinc carboxypeptidase [archaeon]|nr:M14 family zinc carboxypeptidase [archaeon]